MSIILVLFRKEFAGFRRNRAAVVLTFVIPFALIYVFGQVLGVNRAASGPSSIPLGVVNLGTDPAAARLVEALQAEKAFHVITTVRNDDGSARPLNEAEARALIHENEFRFALVIPADIAGASGPHLKLLSNPRNDIETQTVNGLLQKTIFSSAPQLLGRSLQERNKSTVGGAKADAFNRALADNVSRTFGGKADDVLKDIEAGNFGLGQLAGPNTGRGAGGGFPGGLVAIETEQLVGQDVKSPAATRVVGGFAMQFLLFALSSSATALFYERDRGIFQRVLSGPVSRAQILWAKFLWGAALGLLQLMVLFFGGRVLYGIDVEHHLGLLAVVSVFAAGACTSIGMLLASLVSSREAAMGLATFVILLMCSVGGAWFPVSLMPASIQQFSKFTIVYWAMEGFDQVLWANAPLRELLPTLAILGGITAAVMAVAVWRFNRSRIFD